MAPFGCLGLQSWLQPHATFPEARCGCNRPLEARLRCTADLLLGLRGFQATKIKGKTLCLIKLLDGETMQLYAESSSTGQSFLDQVGHDRGILIWHAILVCSAALHIPATAKHLTSGRGRRGGGRWRRRGMSI